MNRILIIILSAFLVAGLPACTSKKKLAEQEALVKKERTEDAKKRLRLLLTDTSRSLEEKEKELATIKAMNLDDTEVNQLISQVETKLLEERRQRELREEQEKEKLQQETLHRKQKEESQARLLDYFTRIAAAGTVEEANGIISEALGLFESEQVPVLIVISKSGSHTDYDRPTTIRRFLELVKDQKKYTSKFENILFNSQGKITELELLK